MPTEHYEVENPTIKTIMRDIGSRIGGALPAGWGFLLHLFSFGDKGSSFYISNADRDDAIRMLQEWIAKQHEVNPDHPVLIAMRHDPERWRKIASVLIAHHVRTLKWPTDAWVDIVKEDVDLLASLQGATIVVSDDKATGFRLKLVDGETAQQLAAKENA